MMYDHMLIDGRNCTYRAIYAGLSDPNFKAHSAVVFFRFVSTYLRKFKPQNVHIFWDCKRKKVWRKQLLESYKEGRDTSRSGKYDKEEINNLVENCCEVVEALTNVLGCRNYMLENQEADDLIYAFCRQCPSDKIIIISSDGDLRQIAFEYKGVDLFSPNNKSKRLYDPTDDVNPIEQKVFVGDKSDNIVGYHKIGPVTAKKIIGDYAKRKEFFKSHDEEVYLMNRAIIDLSINPNLLINIKYISEVLSEKVSLDMSKLHKEIQRYKVRGLNAEISKLAHPFKVMFNGDK